MITKIDHIGISSQNIEAHISVLKGLGYSLVFREADAPNPEEKESVLLDRNPRHELAFLSNATGIGIELLNHGAINGSLSPMSLMLTGAKGLPCEIRGDVVICGIPYREIALSSVPCNAVVLSEDGEFSCRGVCVFVEDIFESIEFWTWFGCKVVNADARSAHLSFRELLSKDSWSIYLVVDAARAGTQYMDGPGVNSVAMVSTSIQKDSDALTALGYETTPIYSIKINQRPLSILFVRGPSGENVEIISPLNKSASPSFVT